MDVTLETLTNNATSLFIAIWSDDSFLHWETEEKMKWAVDTATSIVKMCAGNYAELSTFPNNEEIKEIIEKAYKENFTNIMTSSLLKVSIREYSYGSSDIALAIIQKAEILGYIIPTKKKDRSAVFYELNTETMSQESFEFKKVAKPRTPTPQ